MCPGHRAQHRGGMNTDTITHRPIPTTQPSRPGPARRTAVAITGFLTCALPVVWTVNISRMLLTGVESEHRFHQATGQGLILLALWLGAVVPLVRAGWAGRRPSTRAGLQHVTFVLAGAICAGAATGGGAPALMGLIAVTGALLWCALPSRPRLRGVLRIDPVRTPFALALTAFLVPYSIDQLQLQNAAHGYHAQNPHMFDMAWMATTVTVLALLAAVHSGARTSMAWVAGSCLALGTAGLAFGEGVTWSAVVLGFGLLAAVLNDLPRRFGQ
jgi:hypothetical protein